MLRAHLVQQHSARCVRNRIGRGAVMWNCCVGNEIRTRSYRLRCKGSAMTKTERNRITRKLDSLRGKLNWFIAVEYDYLDIEEVRYLRSVIERLENIKRTVHAHYKAN